MAYSGANPAEGIVSAGNTSVVNLAANAVFTGTSDDVTIYSNIKINVYSSHISAIDGLNYQQSHDGVLWIPGSDVYTIPALAQKSFSIATNLKFFRVVYTNGATATTTLSIQTLYHKSDKQASSIRPQDGRTNDNDYIEILTHLMGYNASTNAWDRIRNTIANGLAVDVTRMPTVTADISDRAARLLGTASVRGLAIAPQSTPFAAAAVG